jgi:hypothetical protein
MWCSEKIKIMFNLNSIIMGAIKTMKEVESALPQKKEINYVRALDKDRNPILINKEDLAQVVGELIGTTTIEKAGLLSPDLFKVYPHFVNAYDSVYKIADNVTDWYRAPIAVLCNDSADTCMDFLSFIYIPDTGLAASLKRILKKPLQVKYYIKGRDLFVSFTFNDELPNHAYILSPHGVQLVGTPDIIDDSFTEITEKL